MRIGSTGLTTIKMTWGRHEVGLTNGGGCIPRMEGESCEGSSTSARTNSMSNCRGETDHYEGVAFSRMRKVVRRRVEKPKG